MEKNYLGMSKKELAEKIKAINEEIYYLFDDGLTQSDDPELSDKQIECVGLLLNKAWEALSEASYDLIYRKYQ